MARPLRIEYEGAWYHVMNRGIDHQAIYHSTEHRHTFLDLLREISAKFFVEIHAYCLMDNHYHLLIRTPLPNLGKAMRHLDGVYTRRFNISVGRDGSIFRGRYHAILVEEEQYLLRVSRYIHLNPISAKICMSPEQYPWSSYMAYTKNNSSPSWLRKNEILKYFSHTKTNNYAEFVSEGIDADVEKFYQKNTKSILGGREFINEKLTTLTNNQKIYCQPSINRFNQPVPVDLIISVIKEYFNVDINHLLNSQAGVKNLPRLFAIAMTKQYGQLTHQKIAENFHPIKANSISTMMDRFEIYLENDEGARRDQQNICNLLRVLSGVT